MLLALTGLSSRNSRRVRSGVSASGSHAAGLSSRARLTRGRTTRPTLPPELIRLILPSAPSCTLTVRSIFVVMGSPGRNNSYCRTAACENDEERPAVYFANRLTTLFAVVPSPINSLKTPRVGKHSRGIGEIKIPALEILAAFRFIPLEYHMGGIAV